MKIINNAKIDVTVCQQIIGVNKSLIIDDKIWGKEYHINSALRDMVGRREIIAVREIKKESRRENKIK